MATQSYYGSGDFDTLYRPNHRHVHNTSYYDRASPYAYYNHPPRPDDRPEYHRRPITRAIIHEQEDNSPADHPQRKRIAVAVRHVIE